MRQFLWIPLAALAFVGCDKDASEQPTQMRSIKVGATNDFQDQLEKLSPPYRGLALRRAVQDSGQRCKRADASAYQGDYKSLKMWTLRCSDTGDWALFLAANGDVQVRACKEMTQLSLPPCVTGPLDTAPQATPATAPPAAG